MTKDFIKQTAKDYDMSIAEVTIIYNKYGNSQKFYEQLEEELKIRRNK